MDLNRLGMKALGCGTVSSDDAMASFDDGMSPLCCGMAFDRFWMTSLGCGQMT